jgi:translocator protein
MNAAMAVLEHVAAFRGGTSFRFAAFMLMVPGIGLVIGALNVPGDWYAALNKPPFNPPDWVFAPVWTLLFVMIAVAGFRTFGSRPSSAAMKLWAIQMVLNFAWSPIFFSLHRIDLALAVIVALFGSILAFFGSRWSSDRVAALLFIPYAAWVGFATMVRFFYSISGLKERGHDLVRAAANGAQLTRRAIAQAHPSA